MKRAVHWLEIILLTIDLQGRIHRLPVKLEMAAGLPQSAFANVGTIDRLVALSQMLLLAELFGQVADEAAVRMPQDQATAQHLRFSAKQLQLFAQLTMIPFLGLFQMVQVNL